MPAVFLAIRMQGPMLYLKQPSVYSPLILFWIGVSWELQMLGKLAQTYKASKEDREFKSRPCTLESSLEINCSSECGPAYDLFVGSSWWDKNRRCEWALGNFIAICSLPSIQECSQQCPLSQQNTEQFSIVEPAPWRTHGMFKHVDPSVTENLPTSFSSEKV